MTMALQSQQPMPAQALAPARLYVWGLSHHALALEEREALALPPAAHTQLEAWLAAHTWRKEHLVLATCNRLEIYCVTREADFAEAVTTQLAEALDYPVERLRAQRYHHTGEEAVRHLFRVCAGVDSQIVGEPEILGQVKASYEKAKASGQLGPWLHRVFQKAFQAAKWVRTHTRIGQGHTSIGQVTVELAERICGDLRAARILVLGAGETAELTLHALWQRQAKHITVANRSPVAAEALTQAVGGRVVDFSIWQEVLSEQDIFIASTAAPDVLLSVEATTQAMRYRRGRFV